VRKPAVAWLFVVFSLLVLSGSGSAATYLKTEAHGIAITTPSVGNTDLIGFKITTNTTNLVIINASLVGGQDATYFYVLNSSHEIICKWAVGSQTSCMLPYVGVYRVIAGADGGLWTKLYDAFAGYPVAGEVMSWDADSYVVCAPYTVGTTCSTPSDYTTYAEVIGSITFNVTVDPGITIQNEARSSSRNGTATVFNVSANVTGGSTFSHCIFSFDNGTGALVNDTPVELSGSTSSCPVTKFVNATFGSTIRYQWFFNATNGTFVSNATSQVYTYATYESPLGKVNLTKFAGNPMCVYDGVGHSQLACGEGSRVEEDGNIYHWRNTHGPGSTQRAIIFSNSTDPYNTSKNSVLTNLINTSTFPAIVFTSDLTFKVNGVFNMFVTTAPNGPIHRYNTSDYGITWTVMCGGSPIITGAVDNSGPVYDSSTGNWHVLVDEEPGFIDNYYNSTDGCTFVDQGPVLSGVALNSWLGLFKANDSDPGKFVSMYSKNNGTAFVTCWASGATVPGLVEQECQILDLQYQSWEWTSPGDTSDQDVLIIHDDVVGTGLFDRQFYVYYLGDQNNTGVAYSTDNTSIFYMFNVSEYQFVSPFVPASVNYTLTVQMNSTNNDTFVTDFCASIGEGYNCTTNGSVFFYELSNGTFNISWTTAGTHLNGSVNVTLAGNTTYVIQASPVLVFVGGVVPSNVVLTSSRNVNISWSPATGNSSVTMYNVTLFNGANVSVVSTGQTSVLYNLTPVDFDGYVVYVTAYDADEQVTRQGQAFNVTLPVAVSAVCPSLTYPNEENLPSVASIQVNVSTTSELSVTSVLTRLHAGTVNLSVNCTLSSSFSTQKNYTCVFPMQYYYAVATYVVDANATTTTTKVGQGSTTCDYGALLASKRSANAISFPSAAPGVINAASSPTIIVRNTGNVPFNITTTGYNLAGRSTPAVVLAASDFVAGVTLPSSVALQHAVQKVVSQNVNGSINTSVYYWVSMPSNQLVQEYFSATPWDLTVTG